MVDKLDERDDRQEEIESCDSRIWLLWETGLKNGANLGCHGRGWARPALPILLRAGSANPMPEGQSLQGGAPRHPSGLWRMGGGGKPMPSHPSSCSASFGQCTLLETPLFSGAKAGCFQGPRPCLSHSGVSVTRMSPLLSPLRSPPLSRSCAGMWGGSAYTQDLGARRKRLSISWIHQDLQPLSPLHCPLIMPQSQNPYSVLKGTHKNHLQAVRLELNKVSVLTFHLSRSMLQQGFRAHHH